MGIKENRRSAVFLARRLFAEAVWKTSNIEMSVTYPQAYDICDNIAPHDLRVNQIVTVHNIAWAWNWLIEHADRPVDWDLVCTCTTGSSVLCSLRAGEPRTFPVGITGNGLEAADPHACQGEVAGEEAVSEESEPGGRLQAAPHHQLRAKLATATNVPRSWSPTITSSIGASAPRGRSCAEQTVRSLLTRYYESGDGVRSAGSSRMTP